MNVDLVPLALPPRARKVLAVVMLGVWALSRNRWRGATVLMTLAAIPKIWVLPLLSLVAVLGVLASGLVQAENIRIIAPQGFMEEATSENIIAGTAMTGYFFATT